MTEKLREMMPYGYVLYTGVVMHDTGVDGYNATQKRINQFIKAGLPVPVYELHDSWARLTGAALVDQPL